MATQNPQMEVMGLTKRIGDRTLFHDLTFTINERERVGLIAKNGTGKSTLLRILADEEGYEAGSIVCRRDLKIGYLPQAPAFDPEQTVGEACLGHADELRTRQILTQLRITDMTQQMKHLSGGMLKRIALARVLEKDPDLLILDEPTNHLDVEMIEWLETYLGRTTKSLLMVTHDRYFLDRVCSSIMEMDDSTIYTYEGNYSYDLQRRQERMQQRAQAIERANNLYRTELEWMRRMPQARGHKARYREEAFYELERIAKQRIAEQNVRLTAGKTYIGSKIFEAKDVSHAFGDNVILKHFSYTFSRFEKMGIVGSNGTGKTTFLRLLLGELQPDEGCFDIGTTVRFGYYSQQGMTLRHDERVIDVIRDIAEYVDWGNSRLSASQLLQHFLFEPEQQYAPVRKLSGGELRRLHLCSVLMRSPNFLILDEPTNDLDIVTLQILEEYLQQFHGCLIVVSHDRYFMDKIVDHLLVFDGQGAVRDFPGNYTQYREWKRLQPKPAAEEKTASAPASASMRNANRKRRLTFNERREMEQLETDIERLEAEQKDIERVLSSGTASVADITTLSKRLPVLTQELDEKSMRWLELSEIESSSNPQSSPS